MERKLRLSGKGTVRFLIVFAAAASAWWFFRSYLLFIMLLVMVGSMVFSAALLWIGREKFYLRISLPEGRVGRGAAFPMRIQVGNSIGVIGFNADITYRWGNVFTGNFQEKREQLWIAPGKGVMKQQFLESSYAGRLEVSAEKFYVYDLLHIFCLTGCERQGASVIAYPRSFFSEEEEIYSCVEGFPKENESKKRGTDYNPDYEIREYIPGDELKSIHWKLTAKQGRLMVRERLATGRERINVLLPLGNDKNENDQLMDSLYSIALLLLSKEYPIQLFWMDQRGTLRTCFLAEQGELENVLGEILSSGGVNLPGNIQEQMMIEYPGENYILIQTGAYKGAYIQ